jgi:uncharacterized protein
MFRSLFLAATLATSLSMSAFAEEQKLTRTISLSGHGEVRVVPDTAIVNSGVLSFAATAREAMDANTTAMKTIMATLTAAKIAPRDIQTSNFMVNPRYDYGQGGNQQPKVVGYDVSNNVTVVVRKVEDLGSLLDSLISAGSNQINGVTFQVADPGAAEDKAREAAVKDATRKANLYAAAATVSIGNIISLNEGQTMQQPTPTYAKTMAADASGAVPVAQGEQAISVDVNIVWEIK